MSTLCKNLLKTVKCWANIDYSFHHSSYYIPFKKISSIMANRDEAFTSLTYYLEDFVFVFQKNS